MLRQTRGIRGVYRRYKRFVKQKGGNGFVPELNSGSRDALQCVSTQNRGCYGETQQDTIY